MKDAAANRAARTRRLLEGPIAPTLVGLAAGNALFAGGQIAAQIAEAAYLGAVGVGALASVALVYPMLTLMQMMSAGAMGGAVNGAVARALGAGRPEDAANLVVHAVLIALGGTSLFMVLMLGFGRATVDFFGATDTTRPAALAYAGVVFLGAPTVWLANTLASVVRGAGAMQTASNALFAAFLCQIVLGGALTLGLGPFPEMGVRGAAFGHLAGFALAAAILAATVLGGRTGLVFGPGTFRLSLARFWDILSVGLAAVLSPAMNVATVLIVTALVARHGPVALAGYGLGARLELMMVPLVFGLGAALTAMVGANVGAAQWVRARRTALVGAGIAAGLTGAVGLTAAIKPDLWLTLFTEDPGALAAGTAYLQRAGPAYALLGFGLAAYFASLGARRIAWPTAAVVLRTGVVAVGGLAVAGEGLEATFLVIAAGMAVLGVFNLIGLSAARWRDRPA